MSLGGGVGFTYPYDVGYCAEYGLDVIYSMGE